MLNNDLFKKTKLYKATYYIDTYMFKKSHLSTITNTQM